MPTSITIARCPNGTHRSPSGDCEEVVPHTGLPRCPNGYHRGPSGNCEQVSSSSSSPSAQSSDRNDRSGSTNFESELIRKAREIGAKIPREFLMFWFKKTDLESYL